MASCSRDNHINQNRSLRVCSSGLILLIHGHFVTFVSVQDLFVKGKQV